MLISVDPWLAIPHSVFFFHLFHNSPVLPYPFTSQLSTLFSLFAFSIFYSLYPLSCFSIPSHSTTVVRLRFQAGGRRRWLNLALVFSLSTLWQSRPNKAGLKCSSFHAYVRTCVHSSVHKTFFDFNAIWHVGRGRWVIYDGMQYDSIQRQGHELFKVGIPAVFQTYLLCHLQWSWQLTTDS